MDGDDQVSALVCDNGSGMVKVRWGEDEEDEEEEE